MNRDRDLDLERSIAERGVSLLESVGEPRALARGFYALGENARGMAKGIEEYYERALALARKHESASDIAHVLWMMSWFRKFEWWDLEEGRTPDLAKHKRFVQEALGELRALGHLPGVAYFLIFSGETLGREQRFEEAKALYVEAKRLAEELGHHDYVFNALRALTFSSIELGEVDRAAAYAQEAYRLAEEAGLRYLVPDTLWPLAKAVWGQGDVEGARELLLRCVELVRVERRGGDSILDVWALLDLAELMAAEGSRGVAVALLAHVVEDRRHMPIGLRSRAKRALSELEGSLSAEEFAAAVERGRKMTLEGVRDFLRV